MTRALNLRPINNDEAHFLERRLAQRSTRVRFDASLAHRPMNDRLARIALAAMDQPIFLRYPAVFEVTDESFDRSRCIGCGDSLKDRLPIEA